MGLTAHLSDFIGGTRGVISAQPCFVLTGDGVELGSGDFRVGDLEGGC